MYEGKQKTYYRGFAKSANEFIIAAFVTELTGPDELPYLTNTLELRLDNQWSSKWYENDFISDFTNHPSEGVLALSRTGNIFSTSNGYLVDRLPENIFSHMHGMSSIGSEIFICGDSGNFFKGELGNFQFINNRFYSPVPGAEATLEERILWAKNTKFFFSADGNGQNAFTVTGSDGLFLSFDGSNIFETTVNPEIRIADQYFNPVDSTVWFCGHTPVSVIGKLRGAEDYEIVFLSQNNEEIVSITHFQNTMFVADSGYQGGVFYLKNGTLHKTAFSDIEKYGTACQVQMKDGVLWALFERALIRYDGQTWEVFRHPDHL